MPDRARRAAPSAKPAANLAAATRAAIGRLRAAVAELPLDSNMSAREYRASRAGYRVPLEAVRLVAQILEDEGAKYPSFDPSAVNGIVEYVSAMSELARALSLLLADVEGSIHKRRKPRPTRPSPSTRRSEPPLASPTAGSRRSITLA